VVDEGPAFDDSITACSLPKTDWTRRRSSRSEGIRRDAPLLAINSTDSFGNSTVNARLCAPALVGGPVTYDPQTSAACPRMSPHVQFP
jgi:hypothetical protein